MQGPAIHVENLSLSLGSSSILENISFDIEAGSIHTLIGPNGGGKTSTLRCILGQMPHKGSIRIDWPDERIIGYVPQMIELEKTLPLTVLDFLTVAIQRRPAFSGITRGLEPAIMDVLTKTGLADKRHLLVGGLSGGERQRLLFAQAMIPDPALLILDEPMTSMDEPGMQLFEELIGDFHKRHGVTVLWVNHNLEQVSRLSDTVTVIDRSCIAHGPAPEVLTADMRRGIFRPAPERGAT